MADDDEGSALPTVVWLVVAVLVIVGLFTIVGWLFSAVWTLVRLAVVVVVVLVAITAVRAARRG